MEHLNSKKTKELLELLSNHMLKTENYGQFEQFSLLKNVRSTVSNSSSPVEKKKEVRNVELGGYITRN